MSMIIKIENMKKFSSRTCSSNTLFIHRQSQLISMIERAKVLADISWCLWWGYKVHVHVNKKFRKKSSHQRHAFPLKRLGLFSVLLNLCSNPRPVADGLQVFYLIERGWVLVDISWCLGWGFPLQRYAIIIPFLIHHQRQLILTTERGWVLVDIS